MVAMTIERFSWLPIRVADVQRANQYQLQRGNRGSGVTSQVLLAFGQHQFLSGRAANETISFVLAACGERPAAKPQAGEGFWK